MATPTLTPNFTVLSTCDANTGWTGLTTVDTEFFIQGSGAVSGITRTTADRYFTPASPVNLSDTHIRFWFNYSAPSYLALAASGGISVYLYDGTNTARYYVLGSDTYNGGWILITLDTTKTPDSGSINISSVTRIGVTINLVSSPRNVVNTWIDYLVYGNSITITGGTAIDPITIDGVAEVDLTSGYGAVRRNNGVYFVNTALIFGDDSGSVNTYFDDDNRIIVFEDQPVNANLYKIEPVGSTLNSTAFNLSNTVIKSANILTGFNLICNNTNLDSLDFDANTLINAAETFFKAGQIIENCIWNNCNMVIPNGATFTGNTVTNSRAMNAFEYPLASIAAISNCNFTNNINAILIATADTYAFDNLRFSGNTYDINNTSGGSVVVNATNGSNPSTYLGTVTINNAVSLTLSGLIAGTEVTILRTGTQTVEAYTFSSGVSFVYTYNYPTGFNIDISLINPGYVAGWFENITLPSSSGSIPISQREDRNFVS